MISQGMLSMCTLRMAQVRHFVEAETVGVFEGAGGLRAFDGEAAELCR